MVSLPDEVVGRYERFSLYNSPYPAHDHGCAVDLYPGSDEAVSPVAGEVIETRTVRCPPKHYAVDEDHLILVDCGDVVARILHVDPSVEAGDTVAVGDSLGTLVRSGFFGQWVDNHIHLGFRDHGQNLRRASGSLPLSLDVDVASVRWDGTGEVAETGPTHILLETPGFGGGAFAALASDEGNPLDGGLVHYTSGGVFGATGESVSLFGTTVGSVDESTEGSDTGWHDVSWADVAIYANDQRATGLSLFVSRVPFGGKVVFHEGHDFTVGDDIELTVEPSSGPIRFG